MERFDERENPAAAADEFDELKTQVDQFLNPKKRVVDEAYRKRMHAALDDLLGRLKQKRTCAGDRQFSKRVGVRP
jgi:hypothetical protein